MRSPATTLSAVLMPAVVTLAGLTAGCGASKLSEAPRVSSLNACFVTRDAARSAANVLYAETGAYPTTFTAMTTGSTPVLRAGNVTVTKRTLAGKGWTLTIGGGASSPPTLACAATPATG